jgi:hypothetical protein
LELVELLRDGSHVGKANAALAVVNLMTNNDDNNAAVLTAGALPPRFPDWWSCCAAARTGAKQTPRWRWGRS